jgi:Protein of unknown function (DUF3489)
LIASEGSAAVGSERAGLFKRFVEEVGVGIHGVSPDTIFISSGASDKQVEIRSGLQISLDLRHSKQGRKTAGAFNLQFRAFRVIDVDREITLLQEQPTWPHWCPKKVAAAAPAKGKKGKRAKKVPIAPRRADVAPTKGKSSRKATAAKKAPKGHTKPNASKPARPGSKTAKVVDLLQRPGGVTSNELIKATGWLPHSVRG